MFPGRRIRALRCANTGQALRLLKRDALGSPARIVIHTGTNDPRALQRHTARALRKAAVRATQELPDSRVVTSTLLPRADTPPHIIAAIKSQIGFLPKHRTTDHIYTLHTLINKHVHQKNYAKIFACIIDFKKAFDSIWHKGLYYKILQSGVGGKVYDIIKSIYINNKCGIKLGKTDFFTQGRGVRQGCSPTLFNIYINELAVLLEQSAAPGFTLNNTEVKFLLYADDLVLLLPTTQELQQHLDLLQKYCQNWALAVNLT